MTSDMRVGPARGPAAVRDRRRVRARRRLRPAGGAVRRRPRRDRGARAGGRARATRRWSPGVRSGSCSRARSPRPTTRSTPAVRPCGWRTSTTGSGCRSTATGGRGPDPVPHARRRHGRVPRAPGAARVPRRHATSSTGRSSPGRAGAPSSSSCCSSACSGGIPARSSTRSPWCWSRSTCCTSTAAICRRPRSTERRAALDALGARDAGAGQHRGVRRAPRRTWTAGSGSARGAGNEGIVMKRPDAPYQPGRRGRLWMKWKPGVGTLDVVVVAAEYGHGKRAGVLSDYTFAVRDGDAARDDRQGVQRADRRRDRRADGVVPRPHAARSRRGPSRRAGDRAGGRVRRDHAERAARLGVRAALSPHRARPGRQAARGDQHARRRAGAVRAAQPAGRRPPRAGGAQAEEASSEA